MTARQAPGGYPRSDNRRRLPARFYGKFVVESRPEAVTAWLSRRRSVHAWGGNANGQLGMAHQPTHGAGGGGDGGDIAGPARLWSLFPVGWITVWRWRRMGALQAGAYNYSGPARHRLYTTRHSAGGSDDCRDNRCWQDGRRNSGRITPTISRWPLMEASMRGATTTKATGNNSTQQPQRSCAGKTLRSGSSALCMARPWSRLAASLEPLPWRGCIRWDRPCVGREWPLWATWQTQLNDHELGAGGGAHGGHFAGRQERGRGRRRVYLQPGSDV